MPVHKIKQENREPKTGKCLLLFHDLANTFVKEKMQEHQ